MSATLASPFSVLAPEESEAARPCPSPGGPRHTARLTSSSLEGPKLLGRHTFPLQKAPRRPALVSPPFPRATSVGPARIMAPRPAEGPAVPALSRTYRWSRPPAPQPHRTPPFPSGPAVSVETLPSGPPAANGRAEANVEGPPTARRPNESGTGGTAVTAAMVGRRAWLGGWHRRPGPSLASRHQKAVLGRK